MATSFFGPKPWAKVTQAARAAGPRYAAIAYLGAEAPRLLPLRKRDVLVVNAGPEALLSHATSPEALEYFVNKGVDVWSSEMLHAKVIATSKSAVVGSANASRNSTSVDEAVVVTSQASVIKAVRDFVNSLDHATWVDETFIAEARKTWKRGQATRVPGVGPGVTPEPPFLPRPMRRLFLDVWEDVELTKPEEELFKTQSRRSRRAAGPAGKYGLVHYRLDSSAGHVPGDVLVHTLNRDGEEWLSAPAVVHTSEQPIPWGRGRVSHVLRYRLDLDDIRLADAEAKLKSIGLARPRLSEARQITSPPMRSGLLALWGL